MFCRIRPYLDQQDSSWATTTDSPLLPLTVEDPDRVSVHLSDKTKAYDFDKVFDADADQSFPLLFVPFPSTHISQVLSFPKHHRLLPRCWMDSMLPLWRTVKRDLAKLIQWYGQMFIEILISNFIESVQQGTSQEPGIIPKALELLFGTMRESANRIRYKTEV